MATRVSLTPSVLLVNDALDEREMYARTLRAYGVPSGQSRDVRRRVSDRDH
jgi:hypothetical protein